LRSTLTTVNEEKEVEKVFECESFEIYAIRVKHSVPASGFLSAGKGQLECRCQKRPKSFNLTGLHLRKIKEEGKDSSE